MDDHEGGTRQRLPKGTLTRSRIVAESLRILDQDGIEGFTMPRLGRALGANQTAVYRHFGSKDELVLAIAERLYEEAFADFVASDGWVQTVRSAVMRIRHTFLQHPAAAALISARVTNQAAEMTAANTIVGAFVDGGFSPKDAALYYRVVADFALLWNGGEAGFAQLPQETQLAEQERWERNYRGVSSEEFPYIDIVKDELFEVSADDVFSTALEMLIESILRRSRHSGG